MESFSKNSSLLLIILTFSIIIFTSCNSTPPSDTSPTSIPPTPQEDNDSGYPSPDPGYPEATQEDGSGYVAQPSNNNLLDTPPSPDFEAPAPETGGAVTGILVQEIVGEGYIPLTPRGLFLGEIVEDSNGDPALFRRGDDAPQAQLLQTGVFIFNNVPSDDYAIIIDVGFAQFPLVDENGDQIVITVVEGQVINLEQIFVELQE